MDYMPNPIKIIMIGPFPKDKIFGGISAIICTFLSSNSLHQYDITYFSTSSKGNLVHKLVSMSINPLRFLVYLVLNDVHILHIHTASWLSFYRKTIYILIGKLLRRKIILQIHGAEFNKFYSWGPGFNRKIISRVLNSVNLILALSERRANDVMEKTENRNIKMIFNPVNTSIFTSHSYKSKIGKKPKKVLFMGKLCERKGIYDLLETVPLVVKKFPNVKFMLCGDGEIANCRQICEQIGITPYVEILGWTTGNDKVRVLRNAYIFVLPSYDEGLPVAILEAMSTGLPIISTRVGGIPDIIRDGVNGFLLEPGDIPGIADRIIKLLNEENLKQKIGKNNFIQARECFDVNVVGKQLSQIYRELLMKN